MSRLPELIAPEGPQLDVANRRPNRHEFRMKHLPLLLFALLVFASQNFAQAVKDREGAARQDRAALEHDAR